MSSERYHPLDVCFRRHQTMAGVVQTVPLVIKDGGASGGALEISIDAVSDTYQWATFTVTRVGPNGERHTTPRSMAHRVHRTRR